MFGERIVQSIQFDDRYRIAVNESKENFDEDVKKGTAILFYLEEKMTLGQAAELSGLSLYNFMMYLGKLKIPVINYSAEDLDDELKALNDYM